MKGIGWNISRQRVQNNVNMILTGVLPCGSASRRGADRSTAVAFNLLFSDFIDF